MPLPPVALSLVNVLLHQLRTPLAAAGGGSGGYSNGYGNGHSAAPAASSGDNGVGQFGVVQVGA